MQVRASTVAIAIAITIKIIGETSLSIEDSTKKYKLMRFGKII